MGRIIRETRKHFNLYYAPYSYTRTVVYYKPLFEGKIPLFTYIKEEHLTLLKGYPNITHTIADDSPGSILYSQKNPIYRRDAYYVYDYQMLNKKLYDELRRRANKAPSRKEVRA